MPDSPHPMGTDSHWELNDSAYQVMYLVKRPAYEFALAIPEALPLFQSADRTFVQVRFRGRCQSQSFVLSWEELEDLYQGLSQLVEYLRTERERCRKSR
jgi:hypothetical protein